MKEIFEDDYDLKNEIPLELSVFYTMIGFEDYKRYLPYKKVLSLYGVKHASELNISKNKLLIYFLANVVDTKVLSFQIPGGMLSNLLNQMKEQGMEDKYPELLEEMPKVRADLGYPPLVTPTSQMVGSMSAFNVMLGRLKVVPNEIKGLVRGEYGRTPGPISDEIRKLIIGDEPMIDHRPADDIAPQMESLKAQLAEKGYPNASVEDVLSYGLFPEVALQFFAKNR